jgi:hypothetical protein
MSCPLRQMHEAEWAIAVPWMPISQVCCIFFHYVILFIYFFSSSFRSSPKLWSSGNPNKDALVITKSYMNIMSNYQPNGVSPIMLIELKVIRDCLMSSNHLCAILLILVAVFRGR